MDPDFEELSNDADLIVRVKQFRDASEKIGDTLKRAADEKFYENLSNEDKIKFNLLMSFGLNSLFWMYLRAEGIDPMTHEIKNENNRLKKAMVRAQEIKDTKTKMPRLNRDAAQRFVRSGLWEPKKKSSKGAETQNQTPQPEFEVWDEEEQNEPVSAPSSKPD
ncbi:nuclear nucleic acid-binding protein C1D [Diachasma alloeum]|uniref:nuclear nucleic acid-binding protein C1D n=1 Tax=Diachasma alloeum TaxID=454923 RepID=UPI0007381582|nr:nuclear nucleic acid-binding protein C1D [Diachasma alloeum]